MQILFNLHAIAAQRGDGLRSEFLRLARVDQAGQNKHLPLHAAAPSLTHKAPALETSDEAHPEPQELDH